MLIWINGAFGAGKTQSAFELHRRLISSHIADPELIGFAIHKMVPPKACADFQDRPQWRSATIATLVDAVAAQPGTVIVPMTLVNSDYFEEIMSGLEDAGVDVRHFALTATPETLRARLYARSGYWVGKAIGRDETWAIQQIERCTSALSAERFGEHIATDIRSVDEVVESIAERAELTLDTPRLGSVQSRVRRATVGLRHIRF